MTSISSAGSSLLDRIAASRTLAARQAAQSGRAISTSATTAASAATSSTVGAAGAAGLTQVTLGATASNDAGLAVYARPMSNFQALRAWATPPEKDDPISALMSRNLGKSATLALADQWRGLGGALLSRFAETPGTYKQSLVSYLGMSDETGAADATNAAAETDETDDAEAAAAKALSGLATGATTVGMKIQTRSGETVELKILVNNGANGSLGLQVEISGSDKLSDKEKEAIAGLASGLDKALDGLGQRKAAKLDLSGLAGFDTSVLTGIDLKIQNPQVGSAVESFDLHLGADKRTLALTGAAGEVKLAVDATTALGDVSPTRRWASIHQYLQKMDAAGARGRVDQQLVEQMKDAFQFLQSAGTPPEDDGKPGKPEMAQDGQTIQAGQNVKAGVKAGTTQFGLGRAGPSQAINPKVTDAEGVAPRESAAQALQSGLLDFDASFKGDFQKLNRYGAAREAGHAEYRLSQATTTEANAATGGQSINQTVKEQLESTWQRSLDGGTLRVDLGNYTAHAVKDISTVATLIEVDKFGQAQGLRKTDREQSQKDSTIVDHRLAGTTGTPVHQTWMERLFA